MLHLIECVAELDHFKGKWTSLLFTLHGMSCRGVSHCRMWDFQNHWNNTMPSRHPYCCLFLNDLQSFFFQKQASKVDNVLRLKLCHQLLFEQNCHTTCFDYLLGKDNDSNPYSGVNSVKREQVHVKRNTIQPISQVNAQTHKIGSMSRSLENKAQIGNTCMSRPWQNKDQIGSVSTWSKLFSKSVALILVIALIVGFLSVVS